MEGMRSFCVRRALCVGLLVSLSGVLSLRADEETRQVEEALRRRNFYFGEVDGQTNGELTQALRRYQDRKGFAVTGTIDDETASSLNVAGVFPPAPPNEPLPDVPVLRSDLARRLSAAELRTLQEKVELSPDEEENVPTPADSPTAGQDLTPAEVHKFVEDYLRDGETQDVAKQVQYFEFPVKYFDHGTVDRRFVTRDTRNYVKRWPQRKYKLEQPLAFYATAQEDETRIEFPIQFHVKSPRLHAHGKTMNYWTVKKIGDRLKITSIREERIREPHSR